MDASTRRTIGIVVALVGLALLAAVLGLMAMEAFVWTEPGTDYDWPVLGGGCCCGVIAGLIFLYGGLQAVMAARAA